MGIDLELLRDRMPHIYKAFNSIYSTSCQVGIKVTFKVINMHFYPKN
jgi:hypothetical protein